MGDPIAEIDMEDPRNLQRAIELALAASDGEGWSEFEASVLHAMAADAPKLWAAYKDKDRPDGSSITAITGNGPTSAANAEFYASARKIVLGLVSEVDRLRTVLRNERAANGGAS